MSLVSSNSIVLVMVVFGAFLMLWFIAFRFENSERATE
jgi:hypothetical protein